MINTIWSDFSPGDFF